MVAKNRVWSFRRGIWRPFATKGRVSRPQLPIRLTVKRPPVIRALAQLSATLIMLASAGGAEHARVVHEAMGKLLPPFEGSRHPRPGRVWCRRGT